MDRLLPALTVRKRNPRHFGKHGTFVALRSTHPHIQIPSLPPRAFRPSPSWVVNNNTRSTQHAAPRHKNNIIKMSSLAAAPTVWAPSSVRRHQSRRSGVAAARASAAGAPRLARNELMGSRVHSDGGLCYIGAMPKNVAKKAGGGRSPSGQLHSVRRERLFAGGFWRRHFYFYTLFLWFHPRRHQHPRSLSLHTFPVSKHAFVIPSCIISALPHA